MAGGVAVAADDGGTGQRKALFRADDMDDALLTVSIADIADAKGGGVGLQGFKLLRAFGVGNRDPCSACVAPCSRWQVVIRYRERQIGSAHGAPGCAQSFESLRAGYFMHQMPVDKDEAGSVIPGGDDMGIPDF